MFGLMQQQSLLISSLIEFAPIGTMATAKLCLGEWKVTFTVTPGPMLQIVPDRWPML
ncbi:MAG: hypothetical protein RI994_518 [Pseudomonadota bacterium]